MTNFQIRNTSSSSEESSKSFHLSARDYVESLHQNSKTTLLYGKNNVLVQPVRLLNLNKNESKVITLILLGNCHVVILL